MGELSKLKTKKRMSVITSTSTEEKRKEVPKGAEIVSKRITTDTEQIENGWLVSKNYDITYRMPNDKSGGNQYAYYTKKWYSKDEPFKIKETVNNKDLASAFEDDL